MNFEFIWNLVFVIWNFTDLTALILFQYYLIILAFTQINKFFYESANVISNILVDVYGLVKGFVNLWDEF